MTGVPKLHVIDVEMLSISERNPRRTAGTSYEPLVDSIKSVGVLQPLVVCSNGDNSYTVLAGSRRLLAAKSAGLRTVPCVLREIDSEAEASTISISENLHRRNVEPLEEAEAIRKMVSEDGLARPDVAAALGISESTVDRRLQLSRLHKPVRDLYRKEDSPIAHFSVRMLEFVATLEDDLQGDLAASWASDFYGRPPGSLRDLIDSVNRKFRKLGGVGWQMDEEDLGGMRACEGCPHNTATRPTLFDDLDYESAICMNEDCFETKRAAHTSRRYDEAKERHGAELVVVNSGFGERPGVGARPMSRWDWEESDGSSAFPAFDVNNPDQTDLRVDVKSRSRSETPSAAAKVDPKAALKRSEVALKRKRFRHAVPRLVEALENADPPKLEVLADLVAAAGGPAARSRREHDTTRLRLPKHANERNQILWESVQGILRSRLDTKQTFDDFIVLRADCQLVAEIIGVSWKELWEEACIACMPSKALIRRREEAAS